MSILAGEKFELRLLSSSEILLHEECEDNRFGRLVERFNEEKVLYNPLIVGKVADSYMLIDGANRFQALQEIGCRSILAQLVDYKSPGVKLRSWYHFINEMSLNELKGYLKSCGIDHEKWDGQRPAEKLNHIGVISSEGQRLLIKFDDSLPEMLSSLAGFNRFYESEYTYTRIDSDTDISSGNVSELSTEHGVLIVYPDFKKEDIIRISQMDQKLPAGISRHLIPNRVLHIKILIEALRSDENLDKRNDELEKFIQYKIDTKKVRLYKEPILVFDE
jgi:L-serine kinase (ATP) / ParB family transcriptional regulator, heme-responsive regulator